MGCVRGGNFRREWSADWFVLEGVLTSHQSTVCSDCPRIVNYMLSQLGSDCGSHGH